MLDMMFFISNDVVTEFKLAVEDFVINGLDSVSWESTPMVLHWLLVAGLELTEVCNLPTKTHIYILEGFNLC